MTNPAEVLAEGLEAMAITSTVAQRDTLLAFLALLQKWNRVYNLTAVKGGTDGVRLHVLDSLSLLPYLRGQRILDVGTGAGLPGIPLAVMCPEKTFVLLDSSSKRTRFVQQACIVLGLNSVQVVTARIEHFDTEQGFDSILVRALGSLRFIHSFAERLLNPGGVVLAQKGRLPVGELQALGALSGRVHRLEVPGLTAERHVVELIAHSSPGR